MLYRGCHRHCNTCPGSCFIGSHAWLRAICVLLILCMDALGLMRGRREFFWRQFAHSMAE